MVQNLNYATICKSCPPRDLDMTTNPSYTTHSLQPHPLTDLDTTTNPSCTTRSLQFSTPQTHSSSGHTAEIPVYEVMMPTYEVIQAGPLPKV